MSHNPERDGAIAYSAEASFWNSFNSNNQNIAIAQQANAEIQKAKNITSAYQAELGKMHKNHAEEVDLLKQERDADVAEKEAEIARKEFELSLKNVDIAKLNLEVTENKMSSYNYQLDRDALFVAIDEKFGEGALDELMDDMHEIAAEFREDDAKEGFPLLNNHKLWGSK